MKYYFYSRQKGFDCGYNVKTWCVGGWEDNTTHKYEGLSGEEILKEKSIPRWFEKECRKYKDWFYYPEKSIFTDIRTLE